MIEIFNESRTKSLGWFVNFKAAKGTLNNLVVSGELGENPSVFVCSYKNDEPQREYTVAYSAYFGKWSVQVQEFPKVRSFGKVSGKKLRHKKNGAKKYQSPEHCFREGFPDWLNRAYPVPACKQQGMDVRRNIHTHNW